MHTCALLKAAESEIYASACMCVILYACLHLRYTLSMPTANTFTCIHVYTLINI